MHYVIDLQIAPYANALKAISQAINKPGLILNSVGESLLNANQDRHAKGLAPDGTPWTPLARSTLYKAVDAKQHKITSIGNKKRGASSNIAAGQKAMANKAARILYQYGDLLRFQYQVGGDALRIGTNDHKAAWHHFGTGTHGEGKGPYTIRPKNRKALAFGGGIFRSVTHPGVPARPLIGFPEGDQSIAARIVAEHLATAAAKK
ncbi:MAG: phage virion morphogenesis protein [Limnohabitans sp.]|nr:phage virion morphogenesis protein [Limnohabitans sp.]